MVGRTEGTKDGILVGLRVGFTRGAFDGLRVGLKICCSCITDVLSVRVVNTTSSFNGAAGNASEVTRLTTANTTTRTKGNFIFERVVIKFELYHVIAGRNCAIN